MRIHFANTGGRPEFEELDLLTISKATSSLCSFAYGESLKRRFENYWNELVNIHLATTCNEKRPDGKGVRVCIADEGCTSSLHSYAYPDRERHFVEPPTVQQSASLLPRVIIDSGAFTAWTTGKTIHPKDYAEWALEFEQRWRPKMAMLEFMNLDVIGDQDGTWQNQSILEGLGMKPLPIVTYGVDLKHLDRALKDYDYIALGGLVPYTRQRDKLRKWLDACFARVMKYRKKTGTMRRVHLLGVTTDWVLKRYPCYSSDSSSWVRCLRFGEAQCAGLDKLPRYKESDAALNATMHALKAKIRQYKNMEAEATKLWESRGIVWND